MLCTPWRSYQLKKKDPIFCSWKDWEPIPSATKRRLCVVSYYVFLTFRPDGRIDFKVDVPFRPAIWLLSGVSLNPETGLAFLESPVMVV